MAVKIISASIILNWLQKSSWMLSLKKWRQNYFDELKLCCYDLLIIELVYNRNTLLTFFVPFYDPVNLSDPRREAGFNLLHNQTPVSQKSTKIPAGNESRAEQDVLFSVCCSILRTLKAGSGTCLLPPLSKARMYNVQLTHSHIKKRETKHNCPFCIQWATTVNTDIQSAPNIWDIII